jgi:hypothetical protein
VLARYEKGIEEPEHRHSATLEIFVLKGRLEAWADDRPEWTSIAPVRQSHNSAIISCIHLTRACEGSALVLSG